MSRFTDCLVEANKERLKQKEHYNQVKEERWQETYQLALEQDKQFEYNWRRKKIRQVRR